LLIIVKILEVKKLTLFLAFLILSGSLFAEDITRKIDSLNNRVKSQVGSERIQSLIYLSEAYRKISIDKTFEAGKSAELYAKQEGLENMNGTILLSLGRSASFSGDYDLALEYFSQAAVALKAIKDYSELAKTHINMGLVYKNLADFDQAIAQFDLAAEISIKHDLTKQLAGSIANKATVFFSMGDFDNAMTNYQQAMLMYKKLNDTLLYAKMAMNVGLVYWQWNKNDLALEMLLESKSLFEEKKDFVELGRVYNNIGRLYYQDVKDTTLALTYFERSLDIRESIGNQLGMSMVMANIGNIYRDKKQYETAFKYYNNALNINRLIGYIEGITMVNYYMGIAYQQQKNYIASNAALDSCLSMSQEYGITTYYSLVNEAKMNNYAALGNHEAFINEFRKFSIQRDTLKKELDELKFKELTARTTINELTSELTSAKAQIVKHETKHTIFGVIIIVLSLTLGLLSLAYLRKKKQKAIK
jgi:tetratricopeptide (TPR) repeat protein